MKEEAAKVPDETKQKFLDLLHEGKTIGEAYRACRLKELGVACEIITQNIGTHLYLNRKAL